MVNKIVVKPTDTVLLIDSTLQLAYNISPGNATYKKIIWSSSNPEIASVDTNGLVKSINTGTASIIGIAQDGGYSDTCFVTIYRNITVFEYNPWTSPLYIYWWNASPSGSLNNVNWPGVKMTAIGNSGWYKYIFYKIYSTNLIFNDGNGHQTPDLYRSSDGWYVDNTWYDTDPSHVSSISTTGSSRTLTKVRDTLKLKAVISPSYALNKKLTWQSNNSSIATVDQNGIVTAVSSGTVVISAISNDGGKIGTFRITVNISTNNIPTLNYGFSISELNPNPASSFVYANYNITNNINVEIKYYTTNGNRIKSQATQLLSSDHNLKLDISDIKPGIYFIEFKSKNFSVVKKLIIN